MRRSILSLLGLVAILVFCIAAKPTPTKCTKQVGGSTGDSVAAAADTSTWILVNQDVEGLWVIAASDSQTIYTTQVSPDTTHWFTVDVDTVAAGEAEATADFGQTYADFAVRVIQDMVPAGGADFGNAWIVEVK